jgi:hypothetical protein
MPAGRPTKYNSKTIDKVKEYMKKRDRENKLPSIEGLALYLDVNRSSIYEWKEKHKEFSNILERLLGDQVQKLFDNGLSGEWNATIAKLVLAKHGYKEQKEVDNTHSLKVLKLSDDEESL